MRPVLNKEAKGDPSCQEKNGPPAKIAIKESSFHYLTTVHKETIFLLKLGLATIPHAGFLSVLIKDKSV
jgi:hypothetical protein